MFPMKIALSKLKALLLLLCEKTDSDLLGKVKLMKLLYFVDFNHVKRYGTPITYDRYVNLEHGPIPSKIMNMIEELSCDPEKAKLGDTIKIVKIVIPAGQMHKVANVRKISSGEMEYFSETELKIIEEICSRFAKSNAKEIEEESHQESPWSKTAYLDEIPYYL